MSNFPDLKYYITTGLACAIGTYWVGNDHSAKNISNHKYNKATKNFMSNKIINKNDISALIHQDHVKILLRHQFQMFLKQFLT